MTKPAIASRMAKWLKIRGSELLAPLQKQLMENGFPKKGKVLLKPDYARRKKTGPLWPVVHIL